MFWFYLKYIILNELILEFRITLKSIKCWIQSFYNKAQKITIGSGIFQDLPRGYLHKDAQSLVLKKRNYNQNVFLLPSLLESWVQMLPEAIVEFVLQYHKNHPPGCKIWRNINVHPHVLPLFMQVCFNIGIVRNLLLEVFEMFVFYLLISKYCGKFSNG
jgi:hypothetical protein